MGRPLSIQTHFLTAPTILPTHGVCRTFLDCDYEIDGVDYVVVGSFGPNKVGMNVYDSDNLYVIVSTND